MSELLLKLLVEIALVVVENRLELIIAKREKHEIIVLRSRKGFFSLVVSVPSILSDRK